MITETRVENPEGLQTGMQGTAKVSTDKVSIAVAIFRKPVRWAWDKIWSIFP